MHAPVIVFSHICTGSCTESDMNYKAKEKKIENGT